MVTVGRKMEISQNRVEKVSFKKGFEGKGRRCDITHVKRGNATGNGTTRSSVSGTKVTGADLTRN